MSRHEVEVAVLRDRVLLAVLALLFRPLELTPCGILAIADSGLLVCIHALVAGSLGPGPVIGAHIRLRLRRQRLPRAGHERERIFVYIPPGVKK